MNINYDAWKDLSNDTPHHSYLNLYKHGTLKLDSLITRRYKLSNINEALDTIRAGLGFSGRCIIDME